MLGNNVETRVTKLHPKAISVISCQRIAIGKGIIIKPSPVVSSENFDCNTHNINPKASPATIPIDEIYQPVVANIPALWLNVLPIA